MRVGRSWIGREQLKLPGKRGMDPIPACAGAAAVALPQRAGHDHGRPAWQSAACERFGPDHDADAAAAVVDGHPKAVRERRGRTDGRSGDGDPQSFERLTGRAGRNGLGHGQLE